MSPDNRHFEREKQLAIRYFSCGRINEALQLCQQICNQTADPAVYTLLGLIHGQLGQYAESVRYCRSALEISPTDINALSCLGNALRRLNDFDGASAAFTQVTRQTPDNFHARYHLGLALESSGRFEEALRHYRNARELNPAYPDALAGEASALNKLGAPQKAYDLLEPLIRAEDTSAQVAVQYGLLARKLNKHKAAIDKLEALLCSREYSDEDRLQIHFILGALLDDSGDYARAFSHYSRANKLKGVVFDVDAFSNGIRRLIGAYTGTVVRDMAHASLNSERLLFIVGMPRSGTSLVERILASHPDVHGAGEQTAMIAIAYEMQKSTTDVTRLDTDRLNRCAGKYLEHIQQLAPGAFRITDKLPDNFLRLGLINALFPDARVIHCRRHPADTCLSCYFQNFSGVLAHTFDLESIGRYYLHYRRLMHHWETVLPLHIHNVEYEKLITQPEIEIPRLLEFAELVPNEACYRFHEDTRFTNTASYDQVCRPLYTQSAGRWRNYRQFIQPLIKILQNLPDSESLFRL